MFKKKRNDREEREINGRFDENNENNENLDSDNFWNKNIPNKFVGGASGLLAAGWLATGLYMVSPTEEGVVTRFGKYVETTQSGLHVKMPWPIEKVSTPEVTKANRLEIGFRTNSETEQKENILGESLMLTGDENIVDLEAIVQYKINDSRNYLFNCNDVKGTLMDASESSLRQVVGDYSIDAALTSGKGKIQDSVKSNLQDTMNNYSCGIDILAVQLKDVNAPTQVLAAFDDVAKAKEDRDRFVNDAKGYANSIIPEARGEAKKMINSAEAYRTAKVDRATGDASRFSQILTEYNKAPEITGNRMYIDTMSEILPNVDLTLVDSSVGKSALPLLNLNGGSAKLEQRIGGQK